MRIHLQTLKCGAGVLLGLVLTPMVPAQAPRPGVHRMEINNGSQMTVRYFGSRLSPGEASSLRDLERAENESTYVQNLQNLKRQYVTDERQLEAQRKLVQQQLYGITLATSLNGPGGAGFINRLGTVTPTFQSDGVGGTFGLAYPGAFAGLGYTGVGYGGIVGGLGTTGPLSSVLAADFTEGGPLKTSLAQIIARDSTDAHAATVEKDLDRAVAMVGGSPRLRVALNLPAARESYVRPVASDAVGPVTVILNDGTKIEGTHLEDGKEWTIIYTSTGRTRVRPTEVKRITEGSSGSGVVPAN